MYLVQWAKLVGSAISERSRYNFYIYNDTEKSRNLRYNTTIKELK